MEISDYIKKWGTLVALVLLAIVFVNSFSIFLLFFGGLLLGVYFVGFSERIRKWTGWKKGITITLSLLINFGVIYLLFWLIGSSLRSQMTDFSDKLPTMLAKAKDFLNDYSTGEYMISSVKNYFSDDFSASLVLQKLFKTSFGVFGDLYAFLFLGIFLSVTPKEYFRGAVTLAPKKHQEEASKLFRSIFSNLKIWLKSQLLEMLIMFVLTAIVLLVLGIDLWLILALITAIFCFIPNIGPVIALIPMVLVGFLDSPQMALYVFVSFMAVQLIETGAIGPYIRKKMLSLPPALVLFFQLILGTISGFWGILLATPLLLVVIILVKKLYLGRTLEN